MVAIVGSTQLSRIFDQTRQLRNLNVELTKQQQQLSNGRYADGLIGVASRAQELGDLKAELRSAEIYKDGVLTAQNRTRLYGLSIEKIIDTAVDAQDLMIKNRDGFFASTSAPTVQANVLLDRIGSLLQTRDTDRYIFAGLNFSTNPINPPLSGAVVNSAGGAVPAAFTAANEASGVGGQPLYLNVANANEVENYYFDTAATNGVAETNFINLYADDSEEIEYGITATDPAFQQLVDAITRFRSAQQDLAGNPTLYTQRVDDAISNLNTAIQSLKTLASTNGHNEQRLTEIQERHSRSIDVLKQRIGNIENVDIGETATLIKSLQTSLEASYTITRDSLSLSLVNYLR